MKEIKVKLRVQAYERGVLPTRTSQLIDDVGYVSKEWVRQHYHPRHGDNWDGGDISNDTPTDDVWDCGDISGTEQVSEIINDIIYDNVSHQCQSFAHPELAGLLQIIRDAVSLNSRDIVALNSLVIDLMKGKVDSQVVEELSKKLIAESTKISENKDILDQVKGQTESLITEVSDNKGVLESVKKQTETLVTEVSKNKTTIGQIGDKASSNSQDIESLKTGVSGNTTAIKDITAADRVLNGKITDMNRLIAILENYSMYSMGLNYKLNEDGQSYSIVGSDSHDCITLVIPKTYNGLPVTAIQGDEYGSNPFGNIYNLRYIVFFENITTINREAFNSDSIYELEGVIVSENNQYFSSQDGILYNKNKTELICLPKKISGDVVISDSAQFTLSEGQFEHNESLTSITLPSTVTEIPNNTFYNCKSLRVVNLPSNVTSIGDDAFSDCGSLESINVDSNNQNYSSQDGILYNKDKTEFIHIPKSVKGDIIIPEGITSIYDGAFWNCSGLTSITIPDSVTSIGASAIRECLNLTNVTIGNSVTSIGTGAFADCDNLANITIPNSVTSIGDGAFRDCKGLTSVTIGNSVTSIWSSSFMGCPIETATIPIVAISYIPKSKLKTVIITSGNSIGERAFENCSSLKSITLPNSVTSIGEDAFYNCSSLTSVTLPDSVTSIGDYAFYDCTNLTSVTIPDSVTSIGNGAFQGCTSLQYKEQDGLLYLGNTSNPYLWLMKVKDNTRSFYNINNQTKHSIDNVFENCTNLTNIFVDENNTNYKSVNGSLYSKDGRTLIKHASSRDIVNFEIPLETTVIEKGAFSGSFIKSLTIPYKVSPLTVSFMSELTNLETLVIPGIEVSTTLTREELWKSNIFTKTNDLRYPFRISDDCILTSTNGDQANGVHNSSSTYTIMLNRDFNFTIYYKTSSEQNCDKLTIKKNSSQIAQTSGQQTNYTSLAVNGKANDKFEFTYKKDGSVDTGSDNCSFYIEEVSLNSDFGKFKRLFTGVIPTTLKTVRLTNEEIIDSEYFYGCSTLNRIILDNSVSIGDDAFSGCSSLTNVTIGNSVTSIGTGAFKNCTALTSVTIPDSVTSISVDAFLGCTGLTSVTIPNSVTSIDANAFYKCSSLTSVTIPNSVTRIESQAFFNCGSLTSVNIPDSVTYIHSWAFNDCSGLTSITVDPNNKVYHSENNCIIESKTNRLVLGCKNSVIPNTITSIGTSAFQGCNSLTSVTIPDSVTSIGNNAFYRCTKLVSVILPNSITKIWYYVFGECSSFRKVYYKGTSTDWLNISISSSNTELTNATRYYYCEGTPTENGNYWNYNEDGSIHEFTYIKPTEGLDFTLNSDGTYSVSHGTCTDLNVIIPPEYRGLPVTSIGDAAFSGSQDPTEYYYIDSVSLPNSLTSIGRMAFYTSTLKTVAIPDSVKYIGTDAFCSCTSLQYNKYDNALYLGNSSNPYLVLIKVKNYSITSCSINSNTKFIQNSAFSGCTGLTNITIPDGVTSIGRGAFNWCSGLTNVTIGNSVTSIGGSAFWNCTNLRNIEFNGTITQWNLISKEDRWNDSVPATYVQCTDGTVVL